jgi:hypothetical protein
MIKIAELYYFSTDGKTYGPFTIDEFLCLRLPESSFVCNNRDQKWIPFSEQGLSQQSSVIKENLKVKKEENETGKKSPKFNLEKKPNSPVINYNITSPITESTEANTQDPEFEQRKDNKNSYLPILIATGIVIGIIALWKLSNTSDPNNELAVVTAVDTAYVAVDGAAMVDTPAVTDKLGDIYNNILAVSEIQQNQIDNLLLSDIMDYKNEILARHGFAFEEPTLLENYNKKEWYRPENNYLVATSNFNEIEKYNFSLLENKLQNVYTELSNKIKEFYTSIVDKTFDATNYFSDNVETFITKSNLDPWSINEEMKNHYNEFTESKYEFSNPLQINLIRSEDGINYISFKFYYTTYRVSKGKQQSCNVTIEWGLDRNQKISSYKEIKIENLKFSDAAINIDSVQ